MEQNLQNIDGKDEAPAQPETLVESRNINIMQVAPWLVSATANNKGFLLKPSDLRMIYLLVLWESLSRRQRETNQIPTIANDEEISIPEADLVNMVQLVFNNTCYSYFNRVDNM